MSRLKSADDRLDKIVNAAIIVFTTYGFEKTSMAKIAEVAGISRPLLYLAFDDKSAIFLAVAHRLHADTAEACLLAAQSPGPLPDRLARVIEAKLDRHVSLVRDSAHGRDLLDLNHRIGAAAARAADRSFQQLVRRMLSDVDGTELDLGSAGLSASSAAELVLDTVRGLEAKVVESEKSLRSNAWRARAKTMALILVRGMS